MYDYREYEEHLIIFLQEPRARAALLKGGLIWRLTKEVMATATSSWDLLVMPMFSAATCNHTRVKSCMMTNYLTQSSTLSVASTLYTPVSLTTHTHTHIYICMYVCIGLLLIFLIGQGIQADQASWWPKHSAFEKCPLNVGYWLLSSEQWFQTRDDIRTGDALTRTATERRNALKLWSPTTAVVNMNEKVAARFLDDFSVV